MNPLVRGDRAHHRERAAGGPVHDRDPDRSAVRGIRPDHRDELLRTRECGRVGRALPKLEAAALRGGGVAGLVADRVVAGPEVRAARGRSGLRPPSLVGRRCRDPAAGGPRRSGRPGWHPRTRPRRSPLRSGRPPSSRPRRLPRPRRRRRPGPVGFRSTFSRSRCSCPDRSGRPSRRHSCPSRRRPRRRRRSSPPCRRRSS